MNYNYLKGKTKLYAGKKTVLLLTILFSIFISVYFNICLGVDIVYSHFYYLPIVMAVLWYGINSLYLAVFMGVVHVGLNYLIYHSLLFPSLIRAFFFIVISLIIYLLTRNKCDYSNVAKTRKTENCSLTDRIANRLSEDCIGQISLAGKIAVALGHEIRNSLTTVRGFLQLLELDNRYKEDEEYFHFMITELDRSNEIITGLIALDPKKTCNRQADNLNRIIYNILPVISQKTDNIRIETDLEPVPDLLLDEKEITRLIEELGNNGLEAMPEGGVLSISTRAENNKVILVIRDQGKGIPADTITNLGAPFFTTSNSSPGLGLAICYSIAQRHNAEIDFSTSSSGTTFRVHFFCSD